ncbi:histidine kinase, partial [Actinomyces johnsonii]
MSFLAFDSQISVTWRPTRRTHLLHTGVAVLLLSTSPVTIGVPLTPSALLVTAMSLACLPLASRLPAAGAAASLAVAWFAANSPYDLGGIALLLPWGLCIMLLGRGLRRDMIYVLAFATTLVHLSAASTWYLGLIQTATFGVPCVVI